MAEEWLRKTTRPVKMAQVDTTAPNVARVWNYLVGGRDNFEVDRRAARQLTGVCPALSEAGAAARAFHRRVVRFLAEAGIRQFVDIGTGLPTAGNTHEIAQDVAPQSRIVYVDNDPIVLSHARALLTSCPEGATSCIEADAREPEMIIEEARLTLDLGQPVAVILIGILNFITDAVMAAEIVRTLRDSIAPGSYMAIMQPASDLDPAMAEAALRWNQMAPTQVALRSRLEVAAWADGLELLEPGVVQVPLWRPDERRPDERRPDKEQPPEAEPPSVMPLYGFVARKGEAR
jgi:O-methyltransferase involved in polyketide biosynthesis